MHPDVCLLEIIQVTEHTEIMYTRNISKGRGKTQGSTGDIKNI